MYANTNLPSSSGIAWSNSPSLGLGLNFSRMTPFLWTDILFGAIPRAVIFFLKVSVTTIVYLPTYISRQL